MIVENIDFYGDHFEIDEKDDDDLGQLYKCWESIHQPQKCRFRQQDKVSTLPISDDIEKTDEKHMRRPHWGINTVTSIMI